MAYFPLVSRPITARPWNRFPSDTWLYADAKYTPYASLVTLGFSFLFTLAWNFHFPTYTEQLLWRICSVYHTAFTIYGGLYYLVETIGNKKKTQAKTMARVATQVEDVETQAKRRHGIYRRGKTLLAWMRTWRNVSPDQDPEMEVPLRIILPVSITCLLYVLCRVYIYFEDFFGLRQQPAGVYLTVNKFIPFLVG